MFCQKRVFLLIGQLKHPYVHVGDALVSFSNLPPENTGAIKKDDKPRNSVHPSIAMANVIEAGFNCTNRWLEAD
jgi:hypothetical protein